MNEKFLGFLPYLRIKPNVAYAIGVCVGIGLSTLVINYLRPDFYKSLYFKSHSKNPIIQVLSTHLGTTYNNFRRVVTFNIDMINGFKTSREENEIGENALDFAIGQTLRSICNTRFGFDACSNAINEIEHPHSDHVIITTGNAIQQCRFVEKTLYEYELQCVGYGIKAD